MTATSLGHLPRVAVGAARPTGPLVDAAWLAGRSSDPTLVLLDVTVDLPRPLHDGDHRAASGRPGWEQVRIPSAQHLDLLHDFADPEGAFHFAHPPVEHARGVLWGLGITDASTVVLYDSADGFWAARAWWSLRGLGVHALILDGGLVAWQGEGRPVVTGADESSDGVGAGMTGAGDVGSRTVGVAGDRGAGVADAASASASSSTSTSTSASASLTLREDPSVWATRQDVLDILAGTRSARLVCALGADQFTGAATTRYSRRGHIPTSVNLSARDLAQSGGRLLDGPELERAVGQVLGEGDDREIIVYCGGGISASYAALGLVSAGRTAVRVYDGSLEEWTADPTLPLTLPAP